MLRSYLFRFKMILTSKLGIAFGVFIGAIFFIWFFGDRIAIGRNRPLGADEDKVLATIAVCLIYFIYLMFVLLKKIFAKKAEKPKEEKRVDPAAPQISKFDESFNHLKKVLKRNWKKDKGVDYKYGLPWYLILGAPSIGKTTLITKSSLRFPLAHLFGKDTIRNVGKTENFDWWITNDALVIDSAGHFIEPEEGKDKDIVNKVWGHFVNQIKGFRGRKPLNGVIVALDAKTILEESSMDRANHAANIHFRIADLIENMKMRFTIHVVITRFDLVDGFMDTFDALSQKERESLLGFSFELTENMKENDKWQKEFDAKLQKFIQAINIKMVERFGQTSKVEVRQKLWLFSRQLVGFKHNLEEFLGLALSSSRYSGAPIIRGVYFTSSKQENVKANAWMNNISQRYNLSLPLSESHRGNSKKLFVDRLFQGAIFKEAGIATNNLRIEGSKKLFAWLIASSSCIVATLACLGLYRSYKINLQNTEYVFDHVSQYSIENISFSGANIDPTGANLLDQMNTLQKGSLYFDGYRDKSFPYSVATLYQGKKVGPIADSKYLELLSKGFMGELAQGIANQIMEDPNEVSDERLRQLQIYLMLGDDKLRDNDLVLSYFENIWAFAYKQDEELQNKLKEHLTYALNNANAEMVKLDDKLIAETQKVLRSVPISMRIYNEIKESAAVDMPNPINLKSEIGTSFDILYQQDVIEGDGTDNTKTMFDSSAYEIPRIFSKDAFHNYFIEKNNDISKIAVKYLYILGFKDRTAELTDADIENIKSQVRSLYVSDYIKTWNNALNSLNIRDFPNLREGEKILETVTGVNTPFSRLINIVVRETTLYENLEKKELERQQKQLEEKQEGSVSNTQDVQLAINVDPYRIEGLRINRAFYPWGALIKTEEDGKAPYIEEVYNTLNALTSYVSSVNNSQKPNAEALRKSKQRLNLEGDDPVYVVRRVADGMPASLKHQVDKLATQSWKVMLDASKKELDRMWKEQVISEWDMKLRYKYPFDFKAKDDVMLEHLSEFFSPSGTLNTFWSKNLEPFLDNRTSKPLIVDGFSLDVSGSFIDNLKEAKRVSQLFFGIDGELNVTFSLKPINMSNNLKRSVLNIEGQLINYTHGAKQPVSIIWPNNLNKTPMVRLDGFSRKNLNLSDAYEGDWAWYRMLRNGRVDNITETSADITLYLGNKDVYTSYHLNIERGSSIILRESLDQFSLVKDLGSNSDVFLYE